MKECTNCGGKGYTYVRVGNKVVKSPCACSNDEAKYLNENAKRLQEEIERRRKEKEN
jgi:hypothetical protein